MFLGSSITGRIESDATLPLDIATNAYSGSTNKEKKNGKKGMQKTLILQGGTNTVSKLQKSSHELLDDMFSHTDGCENKFQPGVFVFMEVISFKETDYNRSKNNLIDEVNA